MAAVTPVPFAVGLVVGVVLFAAMTFVLVQESRRPVQWRPSTVRFGPHVSHTRVAAVCVLFTLWSLWATARPVSGWR
jgi:hypothetical protein